MSDAAFEGYLKQWREASPQRATAWLFLTPAERIRFGALAALEAEWLKAVREVRESQVAATKLGWWREEMQHAAAGEARHPLTQALFADARARAVPVGAWVAAVEAAILAIGLPPAADFEAQCAAATPFANAIAALETGVWFGAGVASPRAARVSALAHLAALARALQAEVEHGRSPLPMNLLARHGLTLEGLAADSEPRRAALRDHAQTLAAALADAARLAGPLTLFRAVAMRYDLAALRRAARSAGDPLPVLRAPAHGIGGVLKTWRAARTCLAAARHPAEP